MLLLKCTINNKVAVENNVQALAYACYQTDEMVLNAIKKDPEVILYVHNQTEEICLEAVKRDGLALGGVRHQTKAICKAAYENDERAYDIIDSVELRAYVLGLS